jgi:hypothetical protein
MVKLHWGSTTVINIEANKAIPVTTCNDFAESFPVRASFSSVDEGNIPKEYESLVKGRLLNP